MRGTFVWRSCCSVKNETCRVLIFLSSQTCAHSTAIKLDGCKNSKLWIDRNWIFTLPLLFLLPPMALGDSVSCRLYISTKRCTLKRLSFYDFLWFCFIFSFSTFLCRASIVGLILCQDAQAEIPHLYHTQTFKHLFECLCVCESHSRLQYSSKISQAIFGKTIIFVPFAHVKTVNLLCTTLRK